MPSDDVSDLKDVFDAINKLCETMKSANYSEDDAPRFIECIEGLNGPDQVSVDSVDSWSQSEMESDVVSSTETELALNLDVQKGTVKAWADQGEETSLISLEEIKEIQAQVWKESEEAQIWKEAQIALSSEESQAQIWKDSHVLIANFDRQEEKDERWSDTQTSPQSLEISVTREIRDRWSDCQTSPPEDGETFTSDTEPAIAQCDPISEMYYTASSEVSLLSDELQDKQSEECVIAGHVAAMRERFESMTRANTPCPDLMRSSSPSLDVFTNITPSPDRLG